MQTIVSVRSTKHEIVLFYMEMKRTMPIIGGNALFYSSLKVLLDSQDHQDTFTLSIWFYY